MGHHPRHEGPVNIVSLVGVPRGGLRLGGAAVLVAVTTGVVALGDRLAPGQDRHTEGGGRQDKRSRRSHLGSFAIWSGRYPGVSVDKAFSGDGFASAVNLAAVKGGTQTRRDTAIPPVHGGCGPSRSHPAMEKIAVARSSGRTA
jgi:hypothetical protein